MCQPAGRIPPSTAIRSAAVPILWTASRYQQPASLGLQLGAKLYRVPALHEL